MRAPHLRRVGGRLAVAGDLELKGPPFAEEGPGLGCGRDDRVVARADLEQALGQAGLEHGPHPLGGLLGHDAVGGQAVVARRDNPLGLGPAQDVHDGGDSHVAAVLLQPHDAGDDLLGLNGGVLDVKAQLAVGATAAAARRSLLTEVAQDGLAQAVGRGAVNRHLVQALLVQRLAAGRGLLVHAVGDGVLEGLADEEALGLHVLLVVYEDAVGRLAVAPRAPRLLVVTLQVAGHVVVDDKTDVGLVDAHAEGVSGHDDGRAVKGEVLLGLAALLGREARVVAAGLDAPGAEQVAYALDGLAGGAVDDAALAPPSPLADQAQQAGVLFARFGPLDAKVEVGSVEAGDQGEGVRQAKARDDVAAHGLGRGGGEGADDRPGPLVGQLVHKGGYAQVGGAEVLTPLGDAMGFVHGHEADGDFPGQLGQAGVVEPLGGHVKELVGAGPGLGKDGPLLLGGLGARDAGGGHPVVDKGLDLVFHEGDEGADDDGAAGEHQGWNLVGQGLAGAGGHDAQHVPATQDGVDEGSLAGPEVAVAEGLAQDLPGRLHGGGGGLRGRGLRVGGFCLRLGQRLFLSHARLSVCPPLSISTIAQPAGFGRAAGGPAGGSGLR